MMEALKGKEVYWVTSFTRNTAYSEQIDSYLTAQLKQYKNLKLIDWAPIAKQDGMLIDGTHPTPKGDEEYLKLIKASGIANN
jgi:hypothetical protein